MLNKQLYLYASKHQVAKQMSGGKQWACMSEQVSSQPIYIQTEFPVQYTIRNIQIKVVCLESGMYTLYNKNQVLGVF
jgi:hypothetical protein